MPFNTVSVIIPNYNCARYLPEAIHSVLVQTHPPHEVIVVDDGSTDGSVSAIQSYKSHLTLLSYPHTGRPGFVRNRGLEASTGDLIAFLDADDVWKPEKLEVQIRYLEVHSDVSLVHSDLDVIDSEGRFLRKFFLGCKGSKGVSDDGPDDSFLQLIKGDSGIGTPSVLLTRECLEHVGVFDESLPATEDWHLWIRIARAFRIGYIQEALAMHRVHTANWGRSYMPRDSVAGIDMWRSILHLYPEIAIQYPQIIHAKFVFNYLFAAHRCFNRGYYFQAARLLAQALMQNPLRIGVKELRRNIAKFRTLRKSRKTASLCHDTPPRKTRAPV